MSYTHVITTSSDPKLSGEIIIIELPTKHWENHLFVEGDKKSTDKNLCNLLEAIELLDKVSGTNEFVRFDHWIGSCKVYHLEGIQGYSRFGLSDQIIIWNP